MCRSWSSNLIVNIILSLLRRPLQNSLQSLLVCYSVAVKEQSGGVHMCVGGGIESNHPTLCKEKVRTQKVASSIVSNRVTWVIP